MKNTKKAVCILLCAVLFLTEASALFNVSRAAESDTDGAGEYTYTLNINVTNPCNSNDMDRDAVNVLYFDFYHTTQNGFGSEKKETVDMSWNGSSNNSSDLLHEHFVRPHDNSYSTSINITLGGKLSRVYIKLNMDGGERLSFTVNSIYCGGVRINGNTDYVSSAYNDSTANIYCSMASSVIDRENSPYFEENDEFSVTETEMKRIVSDLSLGEKYAGLFRDQYGAVIDIAVLKNCISASDGDINQYYSHSDETGMYKYTFLCKVENPIDLTNADRDEVEKFSIQMNYIDKNGYGEAKTYTLNMHYDSTLKRNLNPNYLSCFERNDDNGYNTHFSVWVPGILTEVKCTLNMSGEKLSVYFEKITLNSVAVNTQRDYVSSVYFDSVAKIKCFVPAARIVVGSDGLPESYDPELRDQYGARVSEELFNMAKTAPLQYLYR